MGARRVGVGLFALVLVAGGLVVADRLAAGATADAAARQISATFQGVVGTPEVTIGGFPFLTQLLAGQLTDVGARIEGLTFDGLAVTGVEVDAAGVSTATPYRVDRAELTATLPLATVQQLIAARTELEVTLAAAGSGLAATTTVLGLTVTATLVPRVDAGAIRVDVASVALGGRTIEVADLPGGIGDRLRDLTIPVTGLPPGIALVGVTFTDAGVRITATGRDVVLAAVAARPPA